MEIQDTYRGEKYYTTIDKFLVAMMLEARKDQMSNNFLAHHEVYDTIYVRVKI